MNDNPLNISNTSQKRIRAILESRILICNTIIDTPPRLKKSFIDYYAYILFILVKVINLYENYLKGVSGLHDDLFILRNRFLKHLEGEILSSAIILPFICSKTILLYNTFMDF